MENKTAFDIIRQEKYLQPKSKNPEDTFFCQKHVIEAMEEYGKQQYNQAILDCIENAKAKAVVTPIENKMKSIPTSKTTQLTFIVDAESMKKLLKQ